MKLDSTCTMSDQEKLPSIGGKLIEDYRDDSMHRSITRITDQSRVRQKGSVMASVWYVGTSDKMVITAAQWAAAGVAGASDTVWDKVNGFSLPTASFTPAQLTVLGAEENRFNINAPDGPRPGAAGASTPRRAPVTPRYVPRESLTGPATTDITSVAVGVAQDAAFNEAYAIAANTLPVIWPIDQWGVNTIASNTWVAKTSQAAVGTVSTMRFRCDGNQFAIFGFGPPFWADLYIDGRPYASNPIALAGTPGFGAYGILKVVLPSAKPRLIEIRTLMGVVAIYTVKPYRIWKAAPDPNPKLSVVGDSWVAPSVLHNTAAGPAPGDGYLQGIWQRMAAPLGITSLVTDGIGGTGYINGGGGNLPYNHSSRLTWLQQINPDVHAAHGGCANDLFGGNSVAACIAAVVNYFQTVRNMLPDTKLVFVEGFSPPTFTPATYNPNYKAIRQGVQAGLNIKGMYYLDIASTRPPVLGSGYVTAPVAGENSSIYVGNDQAHLTVLGNDYVGSVLVDKMRRVLADEGRLDGALIL